ncbi:hypothetical protein C1H57_17380 [Clostridium sp. 2-1]|uniref:hypothetical protein n=1 Tax=Clostridium TaxID=1485 RepID=UPI000CDA0203|nr:MULTISPECIES: hypothetical protein [Clostridium]MBN7576233.1 hypothetical protein [Clostridium beijerinckii]MBN7581311.1 hypothetical protein [Clostridium beijerinckii]MBN7586002.1 hypothetical protein [Clostridium beijerinckii]MBO0521931.1 hypothetical protein [Clostridium beijerinckii]POO90032.1 hypothetical protein C1H57_17380 [Clostridium sp. 2-1]
MEEKKSFYEVIIENLTGKWCDGLAILDVSDDEISIDNIYDNNEKRISINDYPIPLKEKVLSKVVEMDYKEAISEFIVNNKNIISPKVSTDEIITFDGCKHIEYGGNVYCHTQNNKIIVNDKHRFDDFNEILETGFISEKEIKGKWLVF